MDGTRFDTLARALTGSGSRRAALTVVLAGGALATRGLGMTEARKKKACPPCKKRKQGKCKGKKPNGTPCSGGTCQGGRCVCVPESPLTTCAGNCITKVNNCGETVLCPCVGGKQCLSNGSCATQCASETCPSGCGCSNPSVEGPKHCISASGGCDVLPACSSTADCELGRHCQSTNPPCSPNPNRCVPLCTA